MWFRLLLDHCLLKKVQFGLQRGSVYLGVLLALVSEVASVGNVVYFRADGFSSGQNRSCSFVSRFVARKMRRYQVTCITLH